MFQFTVLHVFLRPKMVRRLIPWRPQVMLTLWGLAILIGEEAPVMAIEIGMWSSMDWYELCWLINPWTSLLYQWIGLRENLQETMVFTI